MLMFGFTGTSVESNSARTLAAQVSAGYVKGVFFVLSNIASRQDVSELVRLFSANADTPLIAIDHEGGVVQRLGAPHGFTTLPAARQMAQNHSAEEAKALYAKAATELIGLGFNTNLAPVVDLHDPLNPAIGRYDRAYDADPGKVAAYAKACIEGFAAGGVLCSLKHFPGYGHSRDDSHLDLPDITPTWSQEDLEPFRRLIATGDARMIMGAHVQLSSIEPEPISTVLSRAVMTGLLRDKLGFQGVAMTDDLDMSAISTRMSRREAVIRAIAAGNDILMIRNAYFYDHYLPQSIVRWVTEAIGKGVLSQERITRSADRVRALKRTLAGPSAQLSR